MKKRKLTKTEAEILNLLSKEFLTIKEITQRRKTTKQAVYKIIRKLKEKGVISKTLKKVYFSGCGNHQNLPIRLHAQEINIQILYKTSKYQKLKEESNVIIIDGNTINLYNNSIIIYSGHSFYGKDEGEATRNSWDYWLGLITRLEHDLDVILIKNRKHNIKLVKNHYAYTESEVCKNAIENNDKILIPTTDDGKIWFITDDSFGLKEDETIHPETAKQDRNTIDLYVNDWRDNKPLTNSQIVKIQAETVQNLNILTKTMTEYGKHIKSHTRAIKTLSKALPKLVSILEDTKKENEDLKQRRLKDFFTT